MSHHERNGFQRAFTNDMYHVEEQLQDYDEHLYLMWNPRTGEHLIMDGLVNLAVMKIPQQGFPRLSSRVVEHMKHIHTANGFSATQHVIQADMMRERNIERRTDDMAENFARDTLKHAKQIAYYQ